MKKLASVAFVLLIAALGTTMAVAQSSGSFSATGTSASCVIGSGGSFGASGTTLTQFTTNVQTSNGNGVSLLIRPSLVTGLFTQTKISTSTSSATANVGIEVCVEVGNTVAPVYPKSCITYDQRFQQISSDLFSQLAACTVDPVSGLPTDNPLCNFDLILSTLSAHSFDFVVPNVGQGDHSVKVYWNITGADDNLSTLGSKGAACVGPGLLTVTQVKNFTQNDLITISDK